MLQTKTCVLITLQKSNIFNACLGVKRLARCFSLFCSLLVVFYFLPVGRYYLLVARYFFIVAGCFPLVACCLLLFTRYLILAARYFARYFLVAACSFCSSLVTCSVLLVTLFFFARCLLLLFVTYFFVSVFMFSEHCAIKQNM